VYGYNTLVYLGCQQYLFDSAISVAGTHKGLTGSALLFAAAKKVSAEAGGKGYDEVVELTS
jgi:hypothetical protein